jgi:hypothetical protein
MGQDFRVLLIGDTGAWITPDPSDVACEAGWGENTIIRRRFVPEHLMPNLFGAVDVVALLYREANGSSGILSLCQQYGVPVLATCFGEIGAKVNSENLGLTANPHDPDEVQRALKELLAIGTGSDGWRQPRPETTVSWIDVAKAHLTLYGELHATP